MEPTQVDLVDFTKKGGLVVRIQGLIVYGVLGLGFRALEFRSLKIGFRIIT